MGQRTKVLDTEGTTPKFLYSMIRQLDLKLIDWNKVAQDLDISNGHAARMRYSRFRCQMEGPSTSQRVPKRKNIKKEGKEIKFESSGSMPVPLSQIYSGVAPKMEPSNYALHTGSYLKQETGSQGHQNIQPFCDTSELFQSYPIGTSPSMQYLYTPSYATSSIQQGLPNPLGAGMILSSEPAASGSNVTFFGNPSYPMFPIPDDFSMHEEPMVQSTSNHGSIISTTWEPHSPLAPEHEKPSSQPSEINAEEKVEFVEVQKEPISDRAIKKEESVFDKERKSLER